MNLSFNDHAPSTTNWRTIYPHDGFPKLTPSGTAFNGVPADWGWDYETMGQLTTAAASTPDNSRAYQYDAIGNRVEGSAGVPPASTTITYSANALNQYESVSGGGFQPPGPTYDSDGNMETGPVLPDGATAPQNATLTWDAENRLLSATVNGITVDYAYDASNRLIARTTDVPSVSTTLYLYDAWNRIGEYHLHNSSFILHTSYLWGLDLSGAIQCAGGVGGLLAVRIPDPQSSIFYPTYDGNGNISEYLDEYGDPVAHFEYDPFGNLIADSFNNSADFPYRFSTKPADPHIGLLYYGHRWYSPPDGRWPSRDPIGEEGGENLYGFVYNSPIGACDYLGLLDLDFVLTPKTKEQREFFWDSELQARSWVVVLDCAQGALDIVGLIPVLGEPADGANAVLYLMRGKPLDAALSTGAMVPVVGSAAIVTKLTARHADEAAAVLQKAKKELGDLPTSAKSCCNDVPAQLPSAAAKPTTPTPPAHAIQVRNTLDKLPGKKGKTGPIKEVSDSNTLDEVFDSLSRGGKEVSPGNYPGIVREMPDGTIIRRRPASRSGGATLDITMPDGTIIKVHIAT